MTVCSGARTVLACTATFALGVSLLLSPAGSTRADADPPLTIDEAKAQIEKLEVEADALGQQYVGIREELRNGRAQLSVKQADVKAQRAHVGKMRIQVGQVALAKFQNHNLDTAAQLFFTRETEDFLSQISTVEKVSENQNTALQDFQAEQAKLDDLERSSETDVSQLKAKEGQLVNLREASEKKIADSRVILARLAKEERERIAKEEREAREAALAAAKAAEADTAPRRSNSRSADSSNSSSGSAGRDNNNDKAPPGTETSAGSTRGKQAMAFARRQLGKPYRFAAEGPDYYDCSGLVQASWKSVGVSLPRLADDQLEVGRKISRSELQPGDLIGYYSPISHISLYLGNGKIIDAPRPGKTVRIVPIDYMPYNVASRPVG